MYIVQSNCAEFLWLMASALTLQPLCLNGLEFKRIRSCTLPERTSQTMVSWSKSSGEMSRSERALTLPANPLSWILHFSPLPSVNWDPSTLPLNPYSCLWRSFHFTDASSMAQETLYLTGDSASSGLSRSTHSPHLHWVPHGVSVTPTCLTS